MGEKTIRVLVAGQQRLFREALTLVLSRLPDIAAIEHTGSPVEAAQGLTPVNIALIAVNVPDETVALLNQALVAHNPDVRIVVLTREDAGSIPPSQSQRQFERVAVSACLDDLIAAMRGTPHIGMPASQ